MTDREKPGNPKFQKWIGQAIELAASDLLLSPGVYPSVRASRLLQALPATEKLTAQEIDEVIQSVLSKENYQRFLKEREFDFSFSHPQVRFRGNCFFAKSEPNLSLRVIPRTIKTFTQLNLPPILEKISLATHGLVVVTGPTGHGKSTTLASMIEYINHYRRTRIITIEDPVEYEFFNRQSMISQREVGSDTKSFRRALRSCLREDPDVVLVGEMRDLDSVRSALTIAETGHLVLTTLHTNSAAQTIDRIIDLFPAEKQLQVRQQLASVILGVLSQRLLPRASGPGVIPAVEVMLTNNAIRSLIREGKVHQIDNVISTSAHEGMIGLDKVLAELVSQGEVTLETALLWALNTTNLKSMVY